MSEENKSYSLMPYDEVVEAISPLKLLQSVSELHGLMCGYLCAGGLAEGESYLRALVPNKKDESARNALRVLFGLYSASQQQFANFNFEFTLLLPNDEDDLLERARAFADWCEGFTEGLSMMGVDFDEFEEEDSQDAVQHLIDFAQLDYESLEITEDDEQALMEVNEYARMAVMRLYSDLMDHNEDREKGSKDVMH